jgi:hypothetical protein
MKKVIITEEQASKLVKQVTNEQTRSIHDLIHSDPDIHTVEIRKCNFYYHNLKYKGQEIDDVNLGWKFDLKYRVDVEWRSYGIKGISVYDFRGPDKMDLTISYYSPEDPENMGDTIDETIELPVNWDAVVVTEEDDELGYYGVDNNDVEVHLINDQQGNIIIKSIRLLIKHL